MKIKPIETEYNGYKFRSRLEARWAVFFDRAGIVYDYEPEGFDLGDGVYYLPDFKLYNVGWREDRDECSIYVEVKPAYRDCDLTNSDKVKIHKFAHCIGSMNSIDDDDWKINYAFIVLGNIPSYEDFFPTYNDSHFLLNHSLTDGDEYPGFFVINERHREIAKNGIIVPKIRFTGADHLLYGDKIPMNALKHARQARFEHGEKP